MAIVRGKRPANAFSIIRNDVLRDDRLSYRARGVLAVLLSHPDDWSTSSEALARAGQEGRDAIRTALRELEDAGYLVRERRQDSQGRWGTQAVVYDQPQSDGQPALFPDADVSPGHTDDGFPGVGPPTTDSQASVSQALSTKTDYEQSPTGSAEARPADVAGAIAKAVYDAVSGMVNFMAVRQVAARAMKVTPKPTQEAVQATMIALYREGRPITLATVGQRLARNAGGITDTNQEHWSQGGEF